ncbi:hypothetical protein CRG98_009082 [Punica granatum]|uniref:Uncharacterized protein n=1 Tax=Punica granatum TaxID=22663 RepID=A0A2I0KQ16_PUNGR|nr:hypothetical protein CRG98_009082 [Punica granatum]
MATIAQARSSTTSGKVGYLAWEVLIGTRALPPLSAGFVENLCMRLTRATPTGVPTPVLSATWWGKGTSIGPRPFGVGTRPWARA